MPAAHLVPPKSSSIRSVLGVAATLLAAGLLTTAWAGALGRISGLVADPEGNPIQGAVIKFKHFQQGTVRSVAADDKGKYLISTVPYGALTITVEAPGYTPFSEDIEWNAQMTPAVRNFTLGKAAAAGDKPTTQLIEGLTKELAAALDDANEAIAANDWPRAATIYEDVRKTSGNHPLLVMGLVNAYARTKNDAKVQELVTVALGLQPVPAGAHFYQGNIFASQGKKDQAMAEFKAETVTSPANDRAFYNLGALAYELGKKDEALAALEKAKEINPDNGDVATLLSQVYAEKGDTAKAQAAGGSDPMALLNIGIKLYTDHKDRDALATFEKALAADPKLAKAHKMLALTHVRLGDLAKAKASFRKAVELDPKDEESRQMLKELGE